MKTVDEISKYLYENARKGIGKEQFAKVLDEFGNPQDSLEIIHIVGTNGKGSTANFITDILKHHKKVGTFTSPSFLVLNDRIKINNQNISDDDFLRIFNNVFDTYDKYQLGFFELLTLISLLYFSEQKIDVAIYEAGIGGLYDCTSLLNASVLVLTSIGFDHVDLLGNSLDSITKNKVGALKPLATLVTHYFSDEINAIIDEEVANKNAKLIRVKVKEDIQLRMHGEHQKKNATLALDVCKFYGIEEEESLVYLRDSIWRGRFENIAANTYIDGAHNIEGLTSGIETANEIFGEGNYTILASFLEEKDLNEMYQVLLEGSNDIILTTFDYRRAYDYSTLKTKGYRVIEDYMKYLDDAIKTKQNLLITGSLYFISAIVRELKDNDKFR